MQRKADITSNSWLNRTMSALRAGRLEACEKEFAGLGGLGLFDAETTDLDAERLFSQSWYAEEEKTPRLHRIEEMRIQVLSQLPAEICLLSQEEFELALKLAIFGGEIPIPDWDDLPAARSLIRRMWCRARPEKGHWLAMPRQICMAVMLMLASEEIRPVREAISRIIETVDNTLYLSGIVYAEMVVRDMAWQLQGTLGGNRPDLYRRLLKSAFEIRLDQRGRMVLVHPGLADASGLISEHAGLSAPADQQSMEKLYGSLMDMEDPIYDRMLSLIHGLTRSEAGEEDTVEDIMLLAKQGAGVQQMREVLGSRIICLPTDEMTDALREIHDRTPRWSRMNTAEVQ